MKQRYSSFPIVLSYEGSFFDRDLLDRRNLGCPHGPFISTVRKNGRNVFEEITNTFSGKPFELEGW